MKKLLILTVLGLFGVSGAVLAAGSGFGAGRAGAQLGRATSTVANEGKSERIRWTNGTITNWDERSKTFVLRENQGRKKGTRDVTFTWNDKTMVEGMETKVGQHVKVKYTSSGSTNLAHHVFVGQRAIKEHKEDKAAEKAASPD